MHLRREGTGTSKLLNLEPLNFELWTRGGRSEIEDEDELRWGHTFHNLPAPSRTYRNWGQERETVELSNHRTLNSELGGGRSGMVTNSY
jgi:hypothetical protein